MSITQERPDAPSPRRAPVGPGGGDPHPAEPPGCASDGSDAGRMSSPVVATVGETIIAEGALRKSLATAAALRLTSRETAALERRDARHLIVLESASPRARRLGSRVAAAKAVGLLVSSSRGARGQGPRAQGRHILRPASISMARRRAACCSFSSPIPGRGPSRPSASSRKANAGTRSIAASGRTRARRRRVEPRDIEAGAVDGELEEPLNRRHLRRPPARRRRAGADQVQAAYVFEVLRISPGRRTTLDAARPPWPADCRRGRRGRDTCEAGCRGG